MTCCAALMLVSVGVVASPTYHWITPRAARHGQAEPPAGCLAAWPPSGSRIAEAFRPDRAAVLTTPRNPLIVVASIAPRKTSEPARKAVRGLVVPPPR